MANEFVVKNGVVTPNVQINGSSSGITTIAAASSASGTLTLPAATDTLVGKATTDVLTNKSINLANNTLTATSAQILAAVSDETGTGALVFANTPTLVSPILGTPTSGTLTNCTGLPISTGVSGLASGVATFLATPSSSNLLSAITDETGSGSLVFGTSPTISTSIVAGSSTIAVFNTTATTVNAFGAATTINLGANSGTTTINHDMVVTGNLTVNGTTTTINSTITSVDDIALELGSVATPTDVTAAGGGIVLKGTTDKSITWSSTNGWTSTETFNIATGKTYKINGTDVLSATTLGSGITSSSLTAVGTITSGTWSGSFGAVSGANLTSLTAGNLSGTIPSAVLGNSTAYIGTTAVALNRASANLALTGISSVTLPGSTSGTVQIVPAATAGTGTVITLPATTGTVITSGDSGTVTSTMIADGTIVNADINASAAIAVSKLAASTISGVTLGNNLNALTIGTGLSGTSYNGSAGVTIAIDSTVATLTGSQTLTNKTLTYPAIDNIKWTVTQVATAAGTTTLTVTSNMQYRFTGTSTQTVVLPVTSTLTAGTRYLIENASTGNLTVNSSGGNLVATVIPGTTVEFSCIGTTLTTAADWDAEYFSFASITGTGSAVLSTSPTLTTPVIGAATGTSLSLSGNVTAASAVFTATNQIRIKTAADATGYGVIHRKDGSDYYILLTNNNDADGTWNALRPFSINLSTGNVYLSTTQIDGTLSARAASTTNVSLTWGATAGQILRNENSELAIGLEDTSPYAMYIQGRTSTNTARDITLNPLGGNIGIGTQSPTATLHVQNSSNATFNQPTGTWAAKVLQAQDTTAYNGLLVANRWASDTSTAFEVGSLYGSGTAFGSFYKVTGLGTHIWGVNAAGTESMRLNGTGLGIGTNNPSAKLHVKGDIVSENGATSTATSRNPGIRVYTDNAFGAELHYGTGSQSGGWATAIHGRTSDAVALRFGAYAGSATAQNTLVEYMTILNSGNVGVGIVSPSYKLHVNGSFAATTKSFVIDHPTKEGKKLRYGSLEGPENGVYVRGKLKNASVIELPEYWTKLVDPDSITVNLTCIGKYQKLYVMEIKDNKVYIGNENVWNSDFECFYTVYGERCDVEKLEVEID